MLVSLLGIVSLQCCRQYYCSLLLKGILRCNTRKRLARTKTMSDKKTRLVFKLHTVNNALLMRKELSDYLGAFRTHVESLTED